MRTVLVAAVVSGLVIGVGAGLARDRWFTDEVSITYITDSQFVPPQAEFPGAGSINPADFLDLAEAEGGAAALELFIGAAFGAGGPDPEVLRERLSGFGIEFDEGATTAEMLEALAIGAEAIFPAPGE